MIDPTTTPQPPVDIEELERLAKAATPGPWHVAPCKPGCQGADTCTCIRSPDGTAIGERYRSTRVPEDRALIVAMRNSFEALLAEVRSLRAQAQPQGWVAEAYPGPRPPSAETKLVVSPSGFIEGIFRGQPISEGWRVVRYVVAPPSPPEGAR